MSAQMFFFGNQLACVSFDSLGSICCNVPERSVSAFNLRLPGSFRKEQRCVACIVMAGTEATGPHIRDFRIDFNLSNSNGIVTRLQIWMQSVAIAAPESTRFRWYVRLAESLDGVLLQEVTGRQSLCEA